MLEKKGSTSLIIYIDPDVVVILIGEEKEIRGAHARKEATRLLSLFEDD